jgi:single-stranded-DNA-specific exonuclease
MTPAASTRLLVRQAAPALVDGLVRSGLHPLLARLLAARGVHAGSHTMDWAALLPPTALTNACQAASLLADALDAGTRMLIVADYDCDGATACAVGIRALRAFGAHIDYLVPNRFEYGYGLTPEIVRLATTHPRLGRPDLIITVDNGIASVEGVAEANALGIGVLVTDHHLPGEQLPAALSIVNPNQPGCDFPSKHLAGVGVMFYLMLALRAELRRRGRFEGGSEPRLDALLDLVALGTVADVVKLDANNRLLVAQGLKRIRAGRMQAGITALFHVAGREARCASTFDLAYAVGPRLNAAGRLADMGLGIECLLTDDPGRAVALAQQLDEMNRQRRDIEHGMQAGALDGLNTQPMQSQAALCVFDAAWHQGVIGILAGRLKDRYYRPTIAFAPSGEDELKGSGRSIPDVHLRDTLDWITKRYPSLIRKFGGHAMAAGLTIGAADLAAFQAAFDEAVRHFAGRDRFDRVIEVDGALEPSYFRPDTVALLDDHVWGSGFPAPLFADRFTVHSQRLVKDKHLKLSLGLGAHRFDGIAFNRTETLPAVAHLAFRLAANEFNGQTRVSVVVEHALEDG